MKCLLITAMCCISLFHLSAQTINISLHSGLYVNSKPYKSEAFKTSPSLCSSVELGGSIHGWGADIGLMISSPQLKVDFNKLKFADQSENMLPTGETFGTHKYYMAKPLYSVFFSPYKQFSFTKMKIRIGVDAGLNFGQSDTDFDDMLNNSSQQELIKKTSGYFAGANGSVSYKIVKHFYVDMKLQYDYIKLNYPNNQFFDFTALSCMLGLRYSIGK